MSKIEAEISLKTGSFEQAIRKVDASIANLQNRAASFAGGFAGFAAAGAAAFAGLAYAAMKVKETLDLGGELSDLSAAMGLSASQVLTLRQAFQNAGMGGNQFESAIGRMQQALGGVNEEGKSTEAALARLGLTAGDLAGLSADQQLQRLSAAFNTLTDASTRTRTARELFGRSGSKMLVLLSDANAMRTAADQVGALGAVMDENAGRFDNLGDAIEALNVKSQQLWAGITSQLAPAIEGMVETASRTDFTGLGIGLGRAYEQAMNFANGLDAIYQKIPGISLMKDALDKLGFQTWGDMMESGNVEALQKRNAGTETEFDSARKLMATEQEREALLGRITEEINRNAEALAQVQAGTHEVFSSYEPERVEAIKHELQGHIAVLQAQQNATSAVALAQQSVAAAAQQTAEELKKAAAEQERLAKARKDSLDDVRQFRDREAVANADAPDEKRAVLLSQAGVKSTAELDAEIARLEQLQKLGNSSTTEKEIADLKRKLDIRGQIADVDRTARRDADRDQQKMVEEKAQEIQKLSQPMQVQTWATSARASGLGGSAVTNQQDIARIQAERAREANSLLKEIRDTLKANSRLTTPEGVVFS